MNLSELRERIMTLPSLESKLTQCQKEIQKTEAELSRLIAQYERECGDVERIQKESFSSFLLKLLGKYEDKLEKEQREEIEAKLAYDRAAARLVSLKQEKDELAARVFDLRGEEQRYQSELTARRRELAERLTEPEGAQYAELENEQKNILSQITEIKEAQRAAVRAKSTAQRAREALGSAENWATYDAFTRGGILSHMAKYEHIDNAEQLFHALSSQLRSLNTELRDVQNLTLPELTEISSGQRAVDFWFDNIFTDLSVRGQIRDNTEEVNRLLRGLNAVERELNTRLHIREAELTGNKRREEALLLSLR